MKKILILLVVLMAFTSPQISAHDDPEANHSGGPCWIMELFTMPLYCLLTDGTKWEHPPPDRLDKNND